LNLFGRHGTKPEGASTSRAAVLVGVCIAAIVAIAAPGCEFAARAEAPLQKSQSEGFYRMKLGDFEVTALYDGGGKGLITTEMLHGAKSQEIKSLLQRGFVDPAKIDGTVAGFLVNAGDKLVLVDTGTGGNWGGPSLGKLGANLVASGYRPEQVDLVLITHLHADHAGGITSTDGKRVFPNAEILVSKADSDFWLSEEVAKKAPKDAQVFFDVARFVAAPYIAAGKWKPFSDPNESIAPHIKAYPIAGHTPGHTGYEFTSPGQTILFWGDVVHVPSVQIPKPSVSIVFDIDEPNAIKSRQRLFKTLAGSGTIVAGAHMPFPSLGRLRKDGASYDWVPVSYFGNP
jgi:glyoxylase-like metal-dependent hydrolase (beta-lactamase superfamily II)